MRFAKVGGFAVGLRAVYGSVIIASGAAHGR